MLLFLTIQVCPKCAVTASSFPHVYSALPLVSALPMPILAHENSRRVPYSVPLRTLSERVAWVCIGLLAEACPPQQSLQYIQVQNYIWKGFDKGN